MLRRGSPARRQALRWSAPTAACLRHVRALFRDASDLGGNDRRPTGHRFEQDIWPSLAAGAQYQDICRAVPPLELVRGDDPGKMNAVGQTKLTGESLQP